MFDMRNDQRFKETSNQEMTEILYWWDLPGMTNGKARNDDPLTSKMGADSVKISAKSQAAKLLLAHYRNQQGLTDEEAADIAGLNLRSEYRTRCSTLRNLGYLDDTLFTRTSSMGRQNTIRIITPAGKELVKRLNK